MSNINVDNRTIFCRDNLEVLRGINSNSVDLIYLDPPFNKKKTFTAPIGSDAEGASFDDIFRRNDVKDEWLILIRNKHKNIYKFINTVKTISKFEYNWCYLTYMAMRLLQCYRVLKDTGSLYLHCDSTMSHYLKVLLDCIFGEKNFKNEIIWQRKKGSAISKTMSRAHDVIHFYTKTTNFTYNKLYLPYDLQYIDKHYIRRDEKGRYRTHDVIARKGLSGGSTLKYPYKGFTPENGWMMTKDKLLQLEKDNKIVWSSTDTPYKKIYLKDAKGVPLTNLWVDINNVQNSKQATGYPTQKPLKLLKRIIMTSSNEDDVVLDPFCGCATTCVAAEILDRKWIGIDTSEKAYELVRDRLSGAGEQLGIEGGAWKFEGNIMQKIKPPVRTDKPAKPKYDYKQMRKILFAEQSGKCVLCRTSFDHERHLELDHFYPKSLGGTDDIDNRQLLCGSCNRIKGSKSMEEAIEIAKQRNLVKLEY